MIYKKLKDIPEFLAGDHTHLKEVLHPSNDSLSLNFSFKNAFNFVFDFWNFGTLIDFRFFILIIL